MIKDILDKLPDSQGGIKQIIQAVQQNKGTAVFGLNLGEKSAITAAVPNASCFIAKQSDIDVLAQNLKNMGKKPVVLTNFSNDFVLSKRNFGENNFKKLKSLYKLAMGQADTLVITPQMLLEKVSTKEHLLARTLLLKRGQTLERDDLIIALVKLGYIRQDNIGLAGDFASRGLVLDVFCTNLKLPLRVQFFDNEIEEIKLFSLETGLSVKALDQIEIMPNTNVFFDDAKAVVARLKAELNSNKLTATMYASLSEKIAQAQHMIENNDCGFNLGFFAPFISTQSILDFLPKDAVIFADEPKLILQTINETYDELDTSIQQFIKGGMLSQVHSQVIFNVEEIRAKLAGFACAGFQAITTQNNLFSVDKTISVKTLPLIKYGQAHDLLLRDLQNFSAQGFTAVLCTGGETETIFYGDVLKRAGFAPNIVNTANFVKLGDVNILPSVLKAGFCFGADKLVVLGDAELKAARRKEAHVSAQGAKAMLEVPVEGDYVVHAVHGVGVCKGITQLNNAGLVRDYVVLEYKNGDKLYVPTEQLDVLSKLNGVEKKPQLNVIGGQEFGRIKEKVKASVKDMAVDLISLYSAREEAKGVVYHYDSELMQSFADTFPHDETPDQLTAIKDCISDMTNGRVMDRLICGDVGFGKTEVALRAIMLAVLNGKQVAFMAPTTILSQQHFSTCMVRFAQFGIEVRCLNRFRSEQEQKQILAELKSGKAQIVCGTHRLLSQDVQFFDLGLLILDEEQRFGVADKEKIKVLKNNINVLTLSATPIPRTLHMSLSGIRDISLIESPPAMRLPVQSIVVEYSDALLSEAVRRELARDGQVLILYNRVENIMDFAANVRKNLPDGITIQIAHGKMPKEKLEDVIVDVYSGDTKVLIATTLIENGIDLPRANTLFVVGADRLGLAELYQLRGRVGRSNLLAYAYFTYASSTSLTDDAYKRLNAILEFTELGNGYKIALRDLEIRGAGNLLGKEQSGAMTRVGYDMYTKLLSEAVSEIKGEKVEVRRDVVIDVDINAYVDAGFLPEQSDRMRVYSLISSIRSQHDAGRITEQLTDLYGTLPSGVLGLVEVATLKCLSQVLGIRKVSITNEKTSITFYADENDYGEQILGALLKLTYAKSLKREGVSIIVFDVKNKTIAQKIELVKQFLLKCIGAGA